HRVGELGVVVEELAGQVFLGGREVLLQGLGSVGQQRDRALGGGIDGDLRRVGVGLHIEAVLELPQRCGDRRGRHQGDDQQDQPGWLLEHRTPRGPVPPVVPGGVRCGGHRFIGDPDGDPAGFLGGVGGVLHFVGHGTNSTFDILSWPSSRVTLTNSRHDRGSWFAPASLVMLDVAATSTSAESSVIDCTAVAFTETSVITFDSFATVAKSSAALSNSSRNSPVELSMIRCTSSSARLKSSDIRDTIPCRAAAANSAARCFSASTCWWYQTMYPLAASNRQIATMAAARATIPHRSRNR